MSGPWPSSRSVTVRRRSDRAVQRPRGRSTRHHSSSRSSRRRSGRASSTRSGRPGTAVRRSRFPRGNGPVETVVLARGSQKLMDRTRGLPERVLHTAMAAAMRGVDVRHFVAVHDVDGIRAGDLPVAGHVVARPRGRDARRALPGEHGTRTGARRRVRRDRGGRRRRARRSAVPRGTARRRPGRGPPASARVRPGRERMRDDVHRRRGTPAPGRATGWSPAHLRRGAGVPVDTRWSPGAPVAVRSVAPRLSDQPVGSQPPSSRSEPGVRRLRSTTSLEP